MRPATITCLCASLLLASCKKEKETPADAGDTCAAAYTPVGTDFLVDISQAAGIQQGNFDPEPGNVFSNDHCLVAFADLNGDHRDDIVASNLWANPCYSDKQHEMLVFLNRGDRTFADFSDDSGLRDVQGGVKAFGDVDNDGDLDMFAGYSFHEASTCPNPNTQHANSLWLNDGTGRFTRKESAGIEESYQEVLAASAVFGDFDADGNLDLFLAKGHTLGSAPDALFLGAGDGTFVNATSHLTNNPTLQSNGAVACDYDNDGDLDIFVSTFGVSVAFGHNVLWENDGTGTFTDVADARGFAYQETGNYWLASTEYGVATEPASGTDFAGSNGFGIACADANNDGNLDILLTAISYPDDTISMRQWSDPTQLLINTGAAGGFAFRNEFLERGLPFNQGDVDGDLVDFDNDGRLDLSLSRDNTYEDNYEAIDQKGWFGLMRQTADGSFERLGASSGINDLEDTTFERMGGAQNHAWSDFDRDGDLDLLVGGRKTTKIPSVGRPNFLFENRAGRQNRWLAFRLVGDGESVNRDAIGARVTLQVAGGVLVREVQSTRGLWNAADTRVLHFGLADLGCVTGMEVRWPDGRADSFDASALAYNTYHTVDYVGGLVAGL